MERNNKIVKYACYTTSMSMAASANLSPLLFLTFRTLYGVSYSLLGLLVLINFCTQLCVDMVFSLFSYKFNIKKAVKATPVLVIIGLLIYALWPWVFPDTVYPGLVIGTIIFSAACGFAEVLISPVIAAIPAKDPDREMSKLHSVYAWSTAGVVVFSTVFLLVFGTQNWQWLALLFVLIPSVSFSLFIGAKLPEMETPEKLSGTVELLKNRGMWLCFFAIFLGGSSELTMAQWASGYLENALGISKVWGDVFGVALFAVMQGFGRTLYGKIGKNIYRVLLWSAIGSAFCYFVAAISPVPVVGLISCVFTGFCIAMLWPGTLIVASDRFSSGGVFIYAMMAAGGDFGASVGPQLVGIVTDVAMNNPTVMTIAQNIGLMPEQIGMKLGMLVGMLFPLIAIPVYKYIWKTKEKEPI